LDLSYYCSDNNYGEIFYNFWLHPDLIEFSGINVTPLFPELAKKNAYKKLHVAWLRPPMGERHSPYQATQTGQRLKREALGQPRDLQNISGWERLGSTLWAPRGTSPGALGFLSRELMGTLLSTSTTTSTMGTLLPHTQMSVGRRIAGKQNSAVIMAAKTLRENRDFKAGPRELELGWWWPLTEG
jgi:hypothetical protein